MSSTGGLGFPPVPVLRHGPDAMLLGASAFYIIAVALWPNACVVGAGIWWISNTVAHNFIHQPFFSSRALNQLFALFLTAITGIPQRLWRDRHLAHHAETPWKWTLSGELAGQLALLGVEAGVILAAAPRLFLHAILPGLALGLFLCATHGYFEHVRGTTSHYGWLYNRVFFNDGYHREHHARPALHWSLLPLAWDPAPASRWPAVLRWLDWITLDGLERLLFSCAPLRHWVLRVHRRAFEKLTRGLPVPSRIAIVGGGLFPRTALIARSLWPGARVTIFEANPRHLEQCKTWLGGGEELARRHVSIDVLPDADWVIIPLAFDQRKDRLYHRRSGPRLIVHDWIWKTRGCESRIVSFFLLKRLNLVPR